VEASEARRASLSQLSIPLRGPLTSYVGGSFETLYRPSKQLLQHCEYLRIIYGWSSQRLKVSTDAQYAVLGQLPVLRLLESSVYVFHHDEMQAT
jgi:hypothetical protein